MNLIYRPELDNPPMSSECTIGFSFVGTGSQTEHVSIAAGVTRDFPEEVWEKIKDYPVVKRLLSLNAMRVTDEPEEEPKAPPEKVDSLSDLALPQAMELIEASLDPAQLTRWDAQDQRIRVKNAITKRLEALAAGRA